MIQMTIIDVLKVYKLLVPSKITSSKSNCVRKSNKQESQFKEDHDYIEDKRVNL